MNKSDLVKAVQETIAARENKNVSYAHANTVVDAVFNTIRDALAKGEDVRINEIGTLKVVKRAPRNVRNIHTGETFKMPAHYSIKFVVSKVTKENLSRIKRLKKTNKSK